MVIIFSICFCIFELIYKFATNTGDEFVEEGLLFLRRHVIYLLSPNVAAQHSDFIINIYIRDVLSGFYTVLTSSFPVTLHLNSTYLSFGSVLLACLPGGFDIVMWQTSLCYQAHQRSVHPLVEFVTVEYSVV